VKPDGDKETLVCTDKFGQQITVDGQKPPYVGGITVTRNHSLNNPLSLANMPVQEIVSQAEKQFQAWGYEDVISFLSELEHSVNTDYECSRSIETLTLLIDRKYATGKMRRSSLQSLFDKSLTAIFDSIRQAPSEGYAFLSAGESLLSPSNENQTIVIDATLFAPEGEGSLALEIVRLYHQGYRKFVVINARGHRFITNGLGPKSQGVRIDVYGSSGDYLASGIDGAEIFVHGNAQDQVAQIMKDGKLVIYGDVGQTFMYAAKGGAAFVLGNAAGRPLINAVGKPRVVINGTCLDYLSESFMAGDPLNGGGFVILNGISFDDDGQLIDLESPYPGSNLFSLASGGAIYIRDPYQKVSTYQLNGGEFTELTDRDWTVIQPYLKENEQLFAIPLVRLLEVEGRVLSPAEVYRKVRPRAMQALQAEEAWVREEEGS
jgi:glutamate synthase domain-containing protein 3